MGAGQMREREGIVSRREEAVLQVQRDRQQGVDPVVRALLLALCCIAITACAMGGKKSAAPQAAPATTGAAGSPLPASPREQITQLEAQIDAERTKLELPEPSEADYLNAPAQPMGNTPATQD